MIRFDSPVGTQAERDSPKIWPGAWISAEGYDEGYPPAMGRNDFHTGEDLNLNVPAYDTDAHMPVYAVADGIVNFAGSIAVWGNVITIHHVLDDGTPIWSRYGHIESMIVTAGQVVTRGTMIARVGKPPGTGQPFHLHFDIARIDLGARPGDWPNTDRARLRRDYIDPEAFLHQYHTTDVSDPKVGGTMQYQVNGDQHVHVRATPSTIGTIVGKVPTGSLITGTLEGAWVKVPLSFAAPVVRDDDFPTSVLPLAGYMLASLLAPVGVVTPDPTPIGGTLKIGLNVITNGQAARDAAAKGCHAFLIMSAKDVAQELARDPANVVMYREWISTWKLTGQQLADRIGGGPDGVIYTLYNEADSFGYGTVAELNARIDNELEGAKILLAKGAKVAIGTWSVGCPDFTKQEICDVIKARIATIYNSTPNVYLDMHLYSPTLNHVMDEWYEVRYKWLFDKCGFNPSLNKIVCSEGGLDEGGVGGFPDHHVDGAVFTRWMDAFTKASLPQLLCCCLFTYNGPGWDGYNVAGYMGELEKRWQS